MQVRFKFNVAALAKELVAEIKSTMITLQRVA